MRSSKSRSRSKQNRPRTLGNIINRVFDSSGPEGKVRGPPQQIIEKYQLLARDAQLSNDRVAAENFLQHAEHYTRLLAEATREMQTEQDQRQQFQQQNQSGNGNGNGNGAMNRDRPSGDRDFRQDREQRADDYSDDQPYANNPASFDVVGEDDTGLVELPEFARPQRREFSQDRARDDRPQENRGQDNRGQENRPRAERPRDDRPRTDGNRPKQTQDRPREDRRPDQPREQRPDQPREPRAEAPREPRAEAPRDQRAEPRSEARSEPRKEPKETRPEPRTPRFVDQPAVVIPVVAAPVVAAPVAADPVAVAPAAAAPKPAPKPRVRKPVVKTEVPQAE